jgi:hypothetical protein
MEFIIYLLRQYLFSFTSFMRHMLLDFTSGDSRDVRLMNEELYECDWCGVLMDKPVCLSRRGAKHYYSFDCSRARDLHTFIILSLFGIFTGILSQFVPQENRLILGVSLGLLFTCCSYDVYRIREKVPRGSRKGFRHENGVIIES